MICNARIGVFIIFQAVWLELYKAQWVVLALYLKKILIPLHFNGSSRNCTKFHNNNNNNNNNNNVVQYIKPQFRTKICCFVIILQILSLIHIFLNNFLIRLK